MPLLSRPLVVLDTETTGFPEAAWSRVVELAAVRLDTDGSEVDTFAALVRPEIFDARAAGAVRVNGITSEMVADAPLAGEVAESFRVWLGTAAATSFNVAFDRPMVERMGLDKLTWASCIMERAMAVLGPLGKLRKADPSHPRYTPGKEWLWPSLAVSADHFGVVVDGTPHRALTDARTAAGVAVAILRREP